MAFFLVPKGDGVSFTFTLDRVGGELVYIMALSHVPRWVRAYILEHRSVLIDNIDAMGYPFFFKIEEGAFDESYETFDATLDFKLFPTRELAELGDRTREHIAECGLFHLIFRSLFLVYESRVGHGALVDDVGYGGLSGGPEYVGRNVDEMTFEHAYVLKIEETDGDSKILTLKGRLPIKGRLPHWNVDMSANAYGGGRIDESDLLSEFFLTLLEKKLSSY